MSCLMQEDSRTQGCKFPSGFPDQEGDIFYSLLTRSIINNNVV